MQTWESDVDLTISKGELQRIVARAESVIDDKGATGVIGYVHLNALSASLTASGSNHIRTMSSQADATVAKPGTIFVRGLADKLAACPSVDLTLRTVGSSLEIRPATSKAKKPLYSVPFIDGSDFPALPSNNGDVKLTIPSTELARIIAQAGYAAQDDDSRPAMSCLRIEVVKGILTAVAYSHGLLSYASLKVPHVDFADGIATKALKTVAKLCSDFRDEDVTITVVRTAHSGHLHFAWASTCFTVKRVDEGFAPWRRVWPKSFASSFQAPRAELLSAVDRAERVANKEGAITISLTDGLLTVSASGTNGESNTEIDVDYAGGEWLAYFSSAHLRQALSAIADDTVRLNIGGDLDPMLVEGAEDSEACKAVIMPRKP